jgi:hypothetical protein
MKCAIMQPTFMPWAGYFNLISEVDVFVFLDDVQLEKQSWQTRNRILLQGAPAWIAVPVRHRALSQTIGETEVCDQYKWRTKLVRQLTQAYAKHPHRTEMLEVANLLPQIPDEGLAAINIAIIRACCARMGLAPIFATSSELGIAAPRTERLVRMCQHFGCDEYVSPAGAADYLAEDRFTEIGSVRLRLQQYAPKPYPQPRTDVFVSHLSIIDVAASIGWESAKAYVRDRGDQP